MHYTKPPLSFADQTQRLINRGMIVADRDHLTDCLSSVNYYRLSAYWYPFKQADNQFQPGTTFEEVWSRYIFDRQLRLLVMDAIERVEVAILRTRMVEEFTLQYGAFGYCDHGNFHSSFKRKDYKRFLKKCEKAVVHSKEVFVQHFRTKYSSEPHPPLWIMAEMMTYGELFTMFRHLHKREQKTIAASVNLYAPVLDSWLHTLNYTRNAVAHHARLWNRRIPVRPKIPDNRHRPEFYEPVPIENERLFGVLSILYSLLNNVAPQSQWRHRLICLLDDHVDIPRRPMGFPEQWKEHTLWRA